MPIARQDIEKLIEIVVDWFNDQNIWCAKDPQGNFVVIEGIIQRENTRWDQETQSWKFEKYEPWKETKPDEIFVYCYCFNSEGESIDDLAYEEWYIEFLTDNSICLRNTKQKNDESQFDLVPLSRIDQLYFGA